MTVKNVPYNKVVITVNDLEGIYPILTTKEQAKNFVLGLLETEFLFSDSEKSMGIRIKLDRNGTNLTKLFMKQQWEETFISCYLTNGECIINYVPGQEPESLFDN